MTTNKNDRIGKGASQRRNFLRRRLRMESLEQRQLMAGDTVLFADSFEVGTWNGQWVEDSQNDWFRSSQRSTDGSVSAEIDGRANNATLAMATPIDVSSYSSAELTFDWLIESRLDRGEYLSLDISSDGGMSWQTDVRRLSGNSSAENTWHSESVDLTSYGSSELLVRFRSTASASDEDANVDNVRIVATLSGPPEISISDATAVEGGAQVQLLDRFVQGTGLIKPLRTQVLGPDANGDGADDLYVASGATDEVLMFDGASGTLLGAFVPAGLGGLNDPVDLKFGPDGNLYVDSSGTNASDPNDNVILKFDGGTGAFIGEFASGLNHALSFDFGDNGDLYVGNRGTNEVLRFNGSDGTSLGTFIAEAAGPAGTLRQTLIGPDANGDGASDLYVLNEAAGQILKYNGMDGAFLGIHAQLDGYDQLLWADFGSDGSMYVAARENATSSLDVSIFKVEAGSGSVSLYLPLGRDGWSFMVDSNDVLYTSGNSAGPYIDRYGPGAIAGFEIQLNQASSETIVVDFSTAYGSATAGADFESVSGSLMFLPGETTKTILVPTIDDSDLESDETFQVMLSNPTGVEIVDGQGMATIIDDDAAIDPNVIYVWDIDFESRSRRRSTEYRVVVDVHQDANANQVAEASDASQSGVAVTVLFTDAWGSSRTLTGTTDSNGIFRSDWIKGPGSRDYRAEIVDLALAGMAWDPAGLLDATINDDDWDGDGRPDELLTVA